MAQMFESIQRWSGKNRAVRTRVCGGYSALFNSSSVMCEQIFISTRGDSCILIRAQLISDVYQTHLQTFIVQRAAVVMIALSLVLDTSPYC